MIFLAIGFTTMLHHYSKQFFQMNSHTFLGGRPHPYFLGPSFSNAVRGFLALVIISIQTFPLLLRDLSFSNARTVRKYLSNRSGSLYKYKQHGKHPSPSTQYGKQKPSLMTWKRIHLSNPWQPRDHYRA